MADGLQSLFDDIPVASSSPAAPAQAPALESLFEDIPTSAPATPIAPVVALDDAQTRSGGAGIDRLIGVDTGMLSGAESYEAQQRQLAEADALIRQRSQTNTDLRNAPLAEFAPAPNPLFEFERQRAEAEARRTGQPLQPSPMEPTPQQLAKSSRLESEMAKEANIARSQGATWEAIDARNKTNAQQPQSQTDLRNAVESLAAQAVGVPAGIADAGSIVVRKIAEIVGDADSIRNIDETTRQVQSYFNGLARPDAAKADEFTSKAVGGIGSTLGFAVTGAIGKGLGLSMEAATALAGALPQAAKQYRDAEAAKATEAQKWFAFATGLGLGATEALPIAAAMERWAQGVGGFREAFRQTMVSVAEEATQEFGQQLGENVAAGLSYDPKRNPLEGVAESAAIGGIVGGVLGGGGSFATAAMNRPNAGDPGVLPMQAPGVVLPDNVPQGAQPAETVLGPDPSAQPAPSREEILQQAEALRQEAAALTQPRTQQYGDAIERARALRQQADALEAKAGPQRSDPRFELQDILNDPRPVAEIRADMEAAGRLPPNEQQRAAADRTAALEQEGQQQHELDVYGELSQAQPLHPDVRRALETAIGAGLRGEENSTHDIQRALNHGRLDIAEEIAARNQRYAEGMDTTPGVPPESAKYEFIKSDLARRKQEQLAIAARLRTYIDERTKQDGSRSAPVTVDNPAAVTAGAARTAEPTAAQAEAGNYAKRHVKWNGLDISIETEAGQDRKGVATDGTPWSVTLPAPYGYIKRTKGADGDHVDITLGPSPQGRTFIVDQIDPATGRFDEHKLLGGFDSAQQAQQFYEASFSDGSGARRAGAITEIPSDQLRRWVDNANLRRPFRYQPPISAGLTGEQYQGLKQAIATPGQQLDPAALAKQLGASTADVRAVMQRLASRNDIRMASNGRFSRVPQRAYPLELLQFIAQRGGIETKQAREVQDLDRQFLPGFGKIVRPTGRNLDEIREAAVEAGYLREGASVRDLLDAIDWSTRGRKTFAAGDRQRVAELDARKVEDGAANEHLAELEAQFADVVSNYNLDASLGEMVEASELMRDGMSAEDALITAIERGAMRELSDAEANGWLTADEWSEFDQAFGISRMVDPDTQQQDDGGLSGIFDDIDAARPEETRAGPAQGLEQARPGRSEEEGPAPAGEQPRTDRPAEEIGADNRPQLVVPGAERISQREQAERQADKPMRAARPQREAGGMFDEGKTAAQLFDDIPASGPKAGSAERTENGPQKIGENRFGMPVFESADGKRSYISGSTTLEQGDGPLTDAFRTREEADAQRATDTAGTLEERMERWKREDKTWAEVLDLLDSKSLSTEEMRQAAKLWNRGQPAPEKKISVGGAVAKAKREAKSTEPAEADKRLGFNDDAFPLFEDKRGVRYYVKGGIKIFEKVQMQPSRDGGMRISVDHKREPEFERVPQRGDFVDEVKAEVARKPGESDEAYYGRVNDTYWQSPGSTKGKEMWDQARKALEPLTEHEYVTLTKGKSSGIRSAGIAVRKTPIGWTYGADWSSGPSGSGSGALELANRERIYPTRSEAGQKAGAEIIKGLERHVPAGEIKALRETIDREFPPPAAPTPAQTRREALETGTPPIEDDRERQRRENVAKLDAQKGASNTVFTADKAAAARARLKAKLSGTQLNSGIDPETVQDGITLAGYHIEAGARSFAAYTRAMIEDLGETVRPYLRGWYEAVRYYPGFDSKGMSTAAEIEATETAPRATETPETSTSPRQVDTTGAKSRAEVESGRSGNKSDREIIADAFRSEFVNGASYKTIREARALAEKVTGGRITPSTETAKMIDEAIELGVVMAAREIAATDQSESDKFDRLLELYEQQPNLTVRTSTSMIEQAYSTPVPLAYVASRLAGITQESTVFEPSAGNGALLIEAKPENVVANEINADRRAALEAQGFKVLDRDASAGSTGKAARAENGGKTFDVVIENPPFGVVKDEGGASTSYKIDERYSTNEIDHAIVMRSLTSMAGDGRAVLIVGGPNKLARTEEARSNAYNGKAKREFYLTLYGNYNVVDHFTVAGELYAKQGAGYPVDVIVIDGRGKSARKVPAAQVPPVLTTWQDVKGKLNVSEANARTDRQAVETVRGAAAARSEPGADVDRGRVAGRGPDTASVSGRDTGVGSQPGTAVADRGGERPVGRPAQLEQEQRVPASDARQDGAGVQRRATVAEQAQPSLFGNDAEAETAPALTSRPEPKPRQSPAPLLPTAADMTKPQVPYRPRSNAHPMGTLVPVNMQTASQDALSELQKRVGSIDDYVEKELGYQPGELSKYFGAEQVDGIALGIDNFAKNAGFIIGDQTGIGKGRQVAGILRWALRNGRVPIFVTEKPNLYADMFRDLTDIGVEDMLGRELKIFMTNSGETVPLDEAGKRTLKSPQAGPHQQAMNKMIESGKLDGYDMVFTTYAQMQTVKGEETARQKFLRAMAANNGVLALDEAHNAGGGGAEREQKGKPVLTRAKFVREIIGSASAALYSSATYAKRPDVMDLYFKTDLSLAVDKIDDLAELIAKGGVPMQQIVASMLSRAGQYVRRERSFDGIEYNTPVVEVDTRKYEEFSRNISLIQQFSDQFVADATKEMDKRLKEEGRSVAQDGSTGNAGAQSTNFTAIMHNIINQLLLSMKAQDAADRAIAALRANEKPVITLANTNESFIDEFAEQGSIAVGQAIDISFNDLLARYLERSRIVTVRKPFGGDAERIRLTDQDLGPMGVIAFKEAMRSIQKADFSGLPVSPIDWIRSQITRSGYTVTEITGRGLTIDYRADGQAVLKARPAAEKSISGRRAAIAGFNSGKIDAIILNQSGSTGLSLHASERVENKNRRRMILAQAEGNIDTHMQMLGRVNRTGQVNKPVYDQLVAGIPAEKRPASILAKKMASLNANTTGARDSAVTAKDVPDFMNSYGDITAARLMRDNPDLNWRLGEPVRLDSDDASADGAMRKITGRIPLLPLAEQEHLYELLQAEYEALIEQLEASGQNVLEAKTMPLDARTTGVMEVRAGKEKNSPFADAVYMETIDAKRLGKPMSSEQVIATIAKALDVPVPDRNDGRGQWEKLAQIGTQDQREIEREQIKAFTTFADEEVRKAKKDETARSLKTKFDDQQKLWTELHRTLTPGAGVILKTESGNLYGIVTSTEFTGRAKNPLSPSAWRTTVALADPARQISVPFSQMYTPRTKPEKPSDWDIEVATTNSIGSMPLLDAFDDMQIERREERVVVTGNIPAGYNYVGGKGQIVNFADNQGRLRQGILMPRGFNAEKYVKAQAVALADGDKVKLFIDRVPKGLVTSTDGFITIRRTPAGDMEILIDPAKSNGCRYFLDRVVLQVNRRDFVRTGGFMRTSLPPYRAAEMVDALIKAGARFKTDTNLDEAREIVGKPLQFSPTPAGWDSVENIAERPSLTLKEAQDLANIIGRVAGDVGLRWPDVIRVPAGSLAAKSWGKENEAFEASGYFNPVDDVIAISLTAGAPHVAYHEAFHRLQAWALTDAQKAVLVAEADRLKQLIKLSPLGRDIERMSQKEIEADAFGIFANARDLKQGVAGFPARIRMIFDKIYQVVRAAKNWLKGHGYETYESVFEKAWRGDLAAAADDAIMLDQPRSSDPAFSIPPGAQDTPANRRTLMEQAIAKGQPIDSAFRIPFDIFGGLDKEGRWKPGLKLDAQAKRIITEATLNPNGRLAWLNPVIENARQGLIDRYGLDDDYVKRDRARANDERAVLSQGADILKALFERNLTVDETRVLQAMLTGEELKEGDLGKLAEPIIAAIDQLGAEAVSLGLISAESYERNRGAYLHRNYMKDQAQTGLMGMANRAFTSRRKRIIGDQMKGRGIFIDMSQERLLQDDPDFPAAKRGEAMKGEKFRLIQRFTVQENTDGTQTERETKRIWWPADRAVPDKWKADRDGGTWEVRGVAKDGTVTLWRDYSKPEREKMGEILDARYNIGKTFALMAHDLATGRFYKDIAENEDWSQAQVPDQPWKNAEEYSRFWNDPSIEWVKVPDTDIPNTGGKKKWGALAGRFVRAQIWRDINETAIAQQPSLWRKLLGIWKLNKTARSPVTHMNNVMSNVMFMDMADIRARDLVRGIRSFMKEDAMYREAMEQGAFGNDMMAVEFRKDVLGPMLEELQKQETGSDAGSALTGNLSAAGIITNHIWNGAKRIAEKAKAFDQKMIDVYRIEDEVFRMATYIRRREMGDTAQQAADFARRQFLDYDIKAPWVQAARNSVLPFISYPYRAIPLIAEAMAYRPWKLAKYYALAYGANAIAYGLDDEGDEERERNSLRKDEQGRLWTGTFRMMRMPWRDANGLPVFMDIRRWTPAGDIFDMGQGSSAWNIPAPLMPGGPIMLAAEFMLNKVGFTGKAITNERTDTWMDQGGKTGDWLWKSLMPNAPWVPGSWSGERIGRAFWGGTDRAGNPLSMKEALSSAVGVKLAGRDIDEGFQIKFFELRRTLRELQEQARALSRQRSRNLISQTVYEQELANLVRKMGRVGDQNRELAQQAAPRAQRESTK